MCIAALRAVEPLTLGDIASVPAPRRNVIQDTFDRNIISEEKESSEKCNKMYMNLGQTSWNAYFILNKRTLTGDWLDAVPLVSHLKLARYKF